MDSLLPSFSLTHRSTHVHAIISLRLAAHELFPTPVLCKEKELEISKGQPCPQAKQINTTKLGLLMKCQQENVRHHSGMCETKDIIAVICPHFGAH